jgi:hypothetical protein
MVRATGWTCLLLGTILGREDARKGRRDHAFCDLEGDHARINQAKDEYMNPDRIRIIKLHKRWADGLTLLWQIFALLLFGGIYIGLEQFGVGAAEQSVAFILLAVMVLVAAIWQSTGLGVARVHMLLNGIDLEQPPPDRIPKTGDVGK